MRGPSKENYETSDFVNVREIINHLSNFQLIKDLLRKFIIVVNFPTPGFVVQSLMREAFDLSDCSTVT